MLKHVKNRPDRMTGSGTLTLKGERQGEMKRAVLVNEDPDRFSLLGKMLKQKGLTVETARSGSALLALLEAAGPENSVNLVILSSSLEDAAPKPLVEAVTEKSPFSHCVVAGSLEEKDFHDTYEGYGVLMQIPETPGSDHADRLSAHLDTLTRLGSF